MIEYGNNFIRGLQIDNDTVYDSLIQYANIAPDLCDGAVGIKGESIVDFTIKSGLDCDLSKNVPLCVDYCNILQNVLQEYISIFPYSNKYSAFGISTPIILCKYRCGDSFSSWHCERGSSDLKIASRHLTFMTYLNDVDEGGQTEFFHQKVQIFPKKGLTLIWPADWTYTHRGIPSTTQEKYIVTGWFSYYE